MDKSEILDRMLCELHNVWCEASTSYIKIPRGQWRFVTQIVSEIHLLAYNRGWEYPCSLYLNEEMLLFDDDIIMTTLQYKKYKKIINSFREDEIIFFISKEEMTI